MVEQRFARFQTNLGNIPISQDICYVRMKDNNGFLTIYGHRASLLNNLLWCIIPLNKCIHNDGKGLTRP